MTDVIFHQDVAMLPPAAHEQIPVLLYGVRKGPRSDLATIGSPIIDRIKRLGVRISPTIFDFLTLALAVTAADTFVKRKTAADGWAREISLIVPLYEPEPWYAQKDRLEQALQFLSGDMWKLELTKGGYESPIPYQKHDRYRLTDLEGIDSISLFSGGADSTIGAVDLIEGGRTPLLVSHAYKGDRLHQQSIVSKLPGRFSHFSVNAYPLSNDGLPEITMRTRSLNFLAFGAVGASAISSVNQLSEVELYVPENGFISLNVPLAPNRLGTLSTRTTHPYFLELLQSVFDNVGIQTKIINPYRFMTKGEMIRHCTSQEVLKAVMSDTVSCSNWKRKRMQCGRCIPCLIRRAAIFSAGYPEQLGYLYRDLNATLRGDFKKDDLLALTSAIGRLATTSVSSWIMDSGPLPSEPTIRNAYKDVFIRGLREVEQYLKYGGIL